MKTGSRFYPRGISPGILGLLSLCELCPPQETSSWQNRDPKKGKKETHQALWSPVSSCTLSFWVMFSEEMVEVLIVPGTSISSL